MLPVCQIQVVASRLKESKCRALQKGWEKSFSRLSSSSDLEAGVRRVEAECLVFTADRSQRGVGDDSEDCSDELLDESCTRLFFVAIPAKFSTAELLRFAKVDAACVRGALRVHNPETSQVSVFLNFADAVSARQCFYECHGQRFAPPKTEICHVLWAVSLSVCRLAAPSGGVSLPLCPNCVERLDAAITRVWAHSCECAEAICRCTHRWPAVGCRVCKAVHSVHNAFADDRKAKAKAIHKCCAEARDLWLCLCCGNVGCGRRAQRHALKHFAETGHRFTLHLFDLYVWDYVADVFQHRAASYRRVGEEAAKQLAALQSTHAKYLNELMSEVLLEQLHFGEETTECQRRRFQQQMAAKSKRLCALRRRERLFDVYSALATRRKAKASRKRRVQKALAAAKAQTNKLADLRGAYKRKEDEMARTKRQTVDDLKQKIEDALAHL